MDGNHKESLSYVYAQQKELSVLGGIGALLGWDQMTYMPSKGAHERSEQSALLSKLSHERVVSDTFWHHITTLSKPDVFQTLNESDQAVIQRLQEDIEKARKIPADYVQRVAKATTQSYQAWEQARNKNDYTVFKPHLSTIIDLEKEYCGYIGLPGPLYDSLLDGYEEGMTTEKLKKEFLSLKTSLKKILENIMATSLYEKQREDNTIRMSPEKQKQLSAEIISLLHLPKNATRLDVSTHPFTTSLGDQDVRITTNYERKNPLFSFFSTVHEAGHALYELGMPQGPYAHTVIADSPSLGLHESQSRFWENMIARNKSFWEFFYPTFKTYLDSSNQPIDLDSWYQIINQVNPSLIRVEADELTYCLHVILRFEIEVGLIDGNINIAELPQIWAENMNEYLGITPKTDVEGVLQDMHWSGGSIGYFPTYAIGSIYAAQLYRQLEKETPDLSSIIRKGDLESILTWLRTHVHQYGRLLHADDIIKNTCGTGLDSQVFLTYLKEKYYPLYDV